jgi:hypothetical protein
MALLRICWIINALALLLAATALTQLAKFPMFADVEYRELLGAWAVVLGLYVLGLPVSYVAHRMNQRTLATVLAVVPAGLAAFVLAAGLLIVLLFIIT